MEARGTTVGTMMVPGTTAAAQRQARNRALLAYLVFLYRDCGLSLRQCGAHVGISRNAVEQRFRRARQGLAGQGRAWLG
jgi:DNA-directed RNA polymerase specialized sigma24 family protein